MTKNASHIESQPITVQPTVQVPSADLISFRFDRLDEQIGKLDSKVDRMANSYVPRAELDDRFNGVNIKLNTITKAQGLLKETDDIQQGSIDATRRLTSIALTVMGVIVSALALYLGLHK